MIRTLFKIGLLLIAGILIYNYFFGTNEEQENARKVFGQVRGVVVSVGNLIRTEKDKFDAGKYDAALEKLGGVYRAIRDQAKHVDEKVIRRLDELEQRKAQLQQEIDAIEAEDQKALNAPPPKKNAPKTVSKAPDQQKRKEELLRQLEALVKDSDALLQEAQK